MGTQVSAFYKEKGAILGSFFDQNLPFAHWERLHERAQSNPVKHAELAFQRIAGMTAFNRLGQGVNIELDDAGKLCLHGETKILKLKRKSLEKLLVTFDTLKFLKLSNNKGDE